MTPERRIVEPEETVVARQWVNKHVSAATDMQATIEEPLEAVFSVVRAEAIERWPSGEISQSAKFMSTETEDFTLLETITRQRLVKT
jgi:hypothetical protein